jgi:LCP family protein required for cell wall assembly
LPDLREGPHFDSLTAETDDLAKLPGSQPVASVPAAAKKRWWRRLHWKKILKRTALALLVLLLIIGGWLGYKLIRNSNKIGSGFWSLFDNSRLKGEDRGRVNILLAGDSSDDPGHAGADLTDSIMLVSLNVKDKTAFMLSIPRDLYVNIPDDGYAKINSVYQTGNQLKFSQNGYPDGGMGLLESIVSDKLDVPIDYYALINYSAFRDAVNAVGGVSVKIDSQDRRGLYDPFTNLDLPNGWVNLNGQQALNLARARGDGPGAYGFYQADFDRTGHQRQLLVALKDKATSVGVFANPAKISSLFDAAGNNVKTDLSLGNIRRLYSLGKSIDSSKIQSVGLNNADGKNLLMSYRGYGGQSALAPAAGLNNYSDIQAFVAKLSRVSQQ